VRRQYETILNVYWCKTVRVNYVETSPSGPHWLKNNDNNMLFTVVLIGIPYTVRVRKSAAVFEYLRPFDRSNGTRRPKRLNRIIKSLKSVFKNKDPWITLMGVGNSIKILYHVLLNVCMSIGTFSYFVRKPCFIAMLI